MRLVVAAPDAASDSFNHPSELGKELHLDTCFERVDFLSAIDGKGRFGRIINVTGKQPEKLSTANPPKAAVHAGKRSIKIARDGIH